MFLFNDILVITKIHSRRKNSVTYTFRNSHPLTGMIVSLFENAHYSHGITLSQRWDRKVVITLNARNDHDRSKFVEDLKESVAEMDEMEQLRIESELEKQAVAGRGERGEHRDSGMGGEVGGDQEVKLRLAEPAGGLKRGAINNSLLDLATDPGSLLGYSLGLQAQDKPGRRGSVGSLGQCQPWSWPRSLPSNPHPTPRLRDVGVLPVGLGGVGGHREPGVLAPAGQGRDRAQPRRRLQAQEALHRPPVHQPVA